MGEWLLSRRDRLIVARHEVPGLAMQRVPRPGGTVRSHGQFNGQSQRYLSSKGRFMTFSTDNY